MVCHHNTSAWSWDLPSSPPPFHKKTKLGFDTHACISTSPPFFVQAGSWNLECVLLYLLSPFIACYLSHSSLQQGHHSVQMPVDHIASASADLVPISRPSTRWERIHEIVLHSGKLIPELSSISLEQTSFLPVSCNCLQLFQAVLSRVTFDLPGLSLHYFPSAVLLPHLIIYHGLCGWRYRGNYPSIELLDSKTDTIKKGREEIPQMTSALPAAKLRDFEGNEGRLSWQNIFQQGQPYQWAKWSSSLCGCL